MKLIILAGLCLLALPTVLSQGLSCDENWIPTEDRVDCGNPSTEEPECRASNCTWCPAHGSPAGTPWCYVSGEPNTIGYLMDGEPEVTPAGIRVNLKKIENTGSPRGFEGEAQTLIWEAEFQSNYRLRIRITDGTPRWEVPLQIDPASGGNSEPLYDIEFSNDPVFSFKVVRKSSGVALFDSSAGNFIFADQYLTLSWKLPSSNVYGIGENEQTSFKHNFTANQKWTIWAKSNNPAFDRNLYGAQPYYTVLENDGNSHSVAIANTNAQEFGMLEGPKIKYLTIGGIFDFYIFLGPTPENTVQQYTEAVGRAPIPPYWGLGFQLCRYGYNSIENMKAAVDRTAQYQIPHDVQYGDIDIMDRELDFTYSEERFAGLPEYIKELKTKGIKFVTILDPCISIGEAPGTYRPFELGQEMDVWIKRADGTNAVGRMWPDADVYFPDYSNPRTREWWSIVIKEFHDLLEYDGLWIDMNEPANFVQGDVEGCTSNKWNNPPYLPPINGGSLSADTLCPDTVDSVGRHYDTHSMFGWFQSEPTLNGTRQGTGKRALILSRSNYLGSGRWAAHWLGDNYSSWNNLHFSIIGLLQYNQFGIPLSGADICGHNYDATPEICQRWMQLGAFYPFSRNHNGLGSKDQDPGAFGEEVAVSSRKALLIRYTLLPYLYTLFYKHYTRGDTVARPLWHEFPIDAITAGIDRQFMWGSGLMISPVIEEGALSVEAYFPESSRFYDYYDGNAVDASGVFMTLSAPMDFIPLHIRDGHILPTQEPAINTEASKQNPFGLIVALDASGNAAGEMYYDDGDSLNPVENGLYFLSTFEAADRTISNKIENDGFAGISSGVLNTIRLLGAEGVMEITVNGAIHSDFETIASGEVLITNLNLGVNTEFIITY